MDCGHRLGSQVNRGNNVGSLDAAPPPGSPPEFASRSRVHGPAGAPAAWKRFSIPPPVRATSGISFADSVGNVSCATDAGGGNRLFDLVYHPPVSMWR